MDGFNRQDGSVMNLFTKDATWMDAGAREPEGGWERMRAGLLSIFEVFQDARLEPSHIMADGEWVCFEGSFSGIFKGGKWFVGGKERVLPPMNRQISLSAAMFFRATADGLLSYWSLYWDNFQFLAQLGLRPEQIGISESA